MICLEVIRLQMMKMVFRRGSVQVALTLLDQDRSLQSQQVLVQMSVARRPRKLREETDMTREEGVLISTVCSQKRRRLRKASPSVTITQLCSMIFASYVQKKVLRRNLS